MPRLNKKMTKKTVAGIGRSESIARDERLRSLSSLTSKDALNMYINLYIVWEKSRQKKSLQRLNKLKIKHLIQRRKKLDQLANRKQSA